MKKWIKIPSRLVQHIKKHIMCILLDWVNAQLMKNLHTFIHKKMKGLSPRLSDKIDDKNVFLNTSVVWLLCIQNPSKPKQYMNYLVFYGFD